MNELFIARLFSAVASLIILFHTAVTYDPSFLKVLFEIWWGVCFLFWLAMTVSSVFDMKHSKEEKK